MARILVIDDEEVFLDALSEAVELRRWRVTVDTALSADEAADLLRSVEYDVVISDVRMPGMDGIELLKLCKEVRPDTPVVLITGYGDPQLEKEALRLGAYAFIHKPFVVDVFFSVVRRALLRSMLRRRRMPTDPLCVTATPAALAREAS